MVALFLKSVLLGLAVAAPIGPIGVLCINHTLDRGFLAGVGGGLGAALADVLYATLAAMGFAVFAVLLESFSKPLTLLGGLFMIWLGIACLARRENVENKSASRQKKLYGTTVATFALTVANPMTVLTFAAMFAAMGLARSASPSGAWVMVGGVFLGSMVWWCALSGVVSLLRRRLPLKLSLWISRASGGVMISFGLIGTLSLFFP